MLKVYYSLITILVTSDTENSKVTVSKTILKLTDITWMTVKFSAEEKGF